VSDVAALSLGPDEKRCLETLTSRGVEYLLVGGYAVRFHGHLRSTKDVDVLVSNDAENSVRLCDALIEIIGVALPNVRPEQIEGRKCQINFSDWGYPFEVLTAADGVDFREAYERRAIAHLGSVEVPVISKADLIAMKLNAGRPQDLEDVLKLKAAKKA
jgi:hypothetical protein